jgi:Cas6b C-terminal domain/Cas6b N-terminal domain
MRILHLNFDLPLMPRDIAGFRAAVSRAAGYEHDLFHNHRPDGSIQYRYPMVQYRCTYGKASIIGIEEGGEAIYQWFRQCNSILHWNDRDHQLLLKSLFFKEYTLKYTKTPRRYTLRQWLPLNQQHYREWHRCEHLTDRIAMLDRALVAHILTFCRAVNWRLPERLEAGICDIRSTYRTRLMGNDLMGFDVSFHANVILPTGIGLGKAVSHGFGVCRPEENTQ